jgi:uncharacterized YccA/Bax inhibitor family protein
MIGTTNPVLRKKTFAESAGGDINNAMTLQGTVNKSFIMLGLVVIVASWVWNSYQAFLPFLLIAVILGFILVLASSFKKEWSPVIAPIYAVTEGVILGALSAIFERQYPGIVTQAVTLTFATFFCLLIAYKSKLIKVTKKFRLGVIAATGGIAVVYLLSFVLRIFGIQMAFLYQGGPLAIGFSLFVVVIASLNLVLNFDFIAKMSHYKLPSYMEWYSALGLIVTLIWLYIEILRLLALLRRK